MLDLQPGVHLEEREQLLVRAGRGTRRCRRRRSRRPCTRRDRGLAQRPVLLGGQRRGAGLLEHLLVAPLHRAVADARRPDRAVLVGDDLHLDVPAALDQALHEDDRVAERARRLGLVRSSASSSSASERTMRMPRPPPPLRDLTMSG